MNYNHFAVWRQILRATALLLIGVFLASLLFVSAYPREMTPGERYCVANYDIAGSLYNLANIASDKTDYNLLIAESIEPFTTEERAALILIIEAIAPFVWANRKADKETVKGYVLRSCLRYNGPQAGRQA